MLLFVEAGVQNGNQEMREVRSTFIHLQPADNAMIRQILGDASLGNSQVLGEFRLDGFAATPSCAAASHIGNSHAQSLAGFDVIIRRQIRVGENPNARSRRSTVRIVPFYGSTRQEPAKIHFELRKSRSQAGVAIAPAKAWRGDFRGIFRRCARRTFNGSWRFLFGSRWGRVATGGPKRP